MTKKYSLNPYMTPEAIDSLEESMKTHVCSKCNKKSCEGCKEKQLIEKLRSDRRSLND